MQNRDELYAEFDWVPNYKAMSARRVAGEIWRIINSPRRVPDKGDRLCYLAIEYQIKRGLESDVVTTA